MEKINYFLKFGKREHLNQFIKGSLFCSNAETFWGIEDKLKIKGQGDILEAGARVHAQSFLMQSYESGEITNVNINSNILLHFAPAKNIPVFCLFSVYDEDCAYDKEGNSCINLSKYKQHTIEKHFPNADSVAIITKPQQFLCDVSLSIGYPVKKEYVHYFHIDDGFKTDGSNRVAMDMEYLKYLMQDVPPIVENGRKKYSFHVDYVYRALFCKDVFFKDEQEYRIVLPKESIFGGTHYPVKLTEEIKIVSLEDFFNDK